MPNLPRTDTPAENSSISALIASCAGQRRDAVAAGAHQAGSSRDLPLRILRSVDLDQGRTSARLDLHMLAARS